MSDLLNSLFGLEALGFGDDGVRLAFARPLETWIWALIVLAAVAVSAWSYRRLTGPVWARATLAGVRSLVLVLLVLLLTGPSLERPNTRIEQDWVVMLVDRSASMNIADAEIEEGRRVSRETQLRRALEQHAPELAELAQRRQVLWLGFDAGAYDLPVRPAGQNGEQPDRLLFDLGEADGRRTAIGASMEQALRRVAARPVSGVVIFSDGQSADDPSRRVLRRLQADRIGVHAVPLGSPEPLEDLAIRHMDVPSPAFVDDDVPVRVEIERLGAEEELAEPPRGVARLIDEEDGRVLDEVRLEDTEWDRNRAELTLNHRVEEAGARRWRVEIDPEQPDLIEENNVASADVEFIDRPLRVLYLDGYPRWEQRYIKNLLLRERSIESSNMLLAADRRYIQEGDIILDSVPRSPEEWAEFDVIIIGDVRAEVLGSEQIGHIADQVSTRGTGLIWIAGEGATPSSWAGTRLADLLPFTLSGDGAGRTLPTWGEPVTMVPEPTADRLGLLALGEGAEAQGRLWPPRLSDPATGWTRLRWAQRIDASRLKPTAEVIASALPESAYAGPEALRSAAAGEGAPLVVTMRYGAGRIAYIATDETWRWRYGRGETLQERFWIPLVRLLGRESIARTGAGATLRITPEPATVDQTVRIEMRLFDQTVVDRRPSAIPLTIQRETDRDDEATPPQRIALTPETDRPGVGEAYSASWIPQQPGRYRLRPSGPAVDDLDVEGEIRVILPDDEMRRPQTDHAFLERLAEQTGGSVLHPDDLGGLADLLPVRELRIDAPPDQATLWDRPIVFLLILFLLATEWIGRKLLRLA